MKSTFGKINQIFTNTKPYLDLQDQPTVKVFLRGFPKDHEYNVKCSYYDRAGQISHKIMTRMSDKYKFSLEEYVLVA